MMDLAADIVPSKGLGGFYLGKNISEYSELLERYDITGKLSYEQANIYSTRYSFAGFPVEVSVDTRTGLIYKISALEGYVGRLNEAIGIDTKVEDIFCMGQDFFYDECEEAILSSKQDGVALELNEDDPLPDEVNGLKVKAISVFSPEVFKPS